MLCNFCVLNFLSGVYMVALFSGFNGLEHVVLWPLGSGGHSAGSSLQRVGLL